jgi:biopolymer transport protein ExbD
MSAPRTAGLEAAAEPNLAPLIDVLLVLLIISIVLAVPSRALDVALPRPPDRTVPSPRAQPALVVSVRADDVALNGRRLASVAALESELRDHLSVRADRTVFVEAAEPLAYARMVEAIDAARGAGASRIGLLSASPRATRAP